MRRLVPALLLVLLLPACAMIDPHPVYHATTATDTRPVLVVGVPRDEANVYTTTALARELAFALARRGRMALDLPEFLERSALLGAPVPPAIVARLGRGVADADTIAWLRAEGVTLLVFIDVPVYEQLWAGSGKRTRVAVAARGRPLDDSDAAWRAFTTPEVEDEPGRGVELATTAALSALARAISGEAEPTSPFEGFRWKW